MKKKETMEFRFYEVPQGEKVLALIGESWDRVYGHEVPNLHFHNLMEIGICRNGAGILKLGEGSTVYKSGCISVIPENYPHSTISDGERTNFWEYLFFDFRAIVEDLFPDNPVYTNSLIEVVTREPLILEEMREPAIQRLVNSVIAECRAKDEHYKVMTGLYMKALVLEIVRQYSDSLSGIREATSQLNQSKVAPAVNFIQNHYTEDLKISDVSNAINMSETHFRRLFEKHFNMPPMDYVNLIRIQNACELMKKTSLSMDDVAIKVGYTSTSTFNRNFKKFLDTSPYQWKINPQNYEGKLLNYNISALKGW